MAQHAPQLVARIKAGAEIADGAAGALGRVQGIGIVETEIEQLFAVVTVHEIGHVNHGGQVVFRAAVRRVMAGHGLAQAVRQLPFAAHPAAQDGMTPKADNCPLVPPLLLTGSNIRSRLRGLILSAPPAVSVAITDLFMSGRDLG